MRGPARSAQGGDRKGTCYQVPCQYRAAAVISISDPVILRIVNSVLEQFRSVWKLRQALEAS
jgi:hypothetical protein